MDRNVLYHSVKRKTGDDTNRTETVWNGGTVTGNESYDDSFDSLDLNVIPTVLAPVKKEEKETNMVADKARCISTTEAFLDSLVGIKQEQEQERIPPVRSHIFGNRARPYTLHHGP